MTRVIQFLKQHYEKIILSVLLLALGAAAFWLYTSVQEANTQMTPVNTQAPPEKAWQPINLTEAANALKALHVPPPLELSGEHNLFSPVSWKRFPDGRLRKVLRDGAAALVISNIAPLYEYIRLDSKIGSELYRLSYEPLGKPPVKWNSGLNDVERGRPCKIIATNDAPDGTPGIKLLILATGETPDVTPSNPYKHVAGYEAELRYEVNNETFRRVRVGATLQLSEQQYKVFAITNNTVTVQDTRTTKRTTLDWPGAH